MEDGLAIGALMVPMLFAFAVMAFFAYCYWRVFEKAGEPGWAALIPVYNALVLLRIIGRPAWWILLMFIPLVSFVVAIILMIDLAQSFGKDGGFAVGLVLLPIVFIPILALGDAQYVRNNARQLDQPYGQIPAR